jgi:hypothetical protein
MGSGTCQGSSRCCPPKVPGSWSRNCEIRTALGRGRASRACPDRQDSTKGEHPPLQLPSGSRGNTTRNRPAIIALALTLASNVPSPSVHPSVKRSQWPDGNARGTRRPIIIYSHGILLPVQDPARIPERAARDSAHQTRQRRIACSTRTSVYSGLLQPSGRGTTVDRRDGLVRICGNRG